jgi:putative ABC transport system permease protein
VVSESFVKRYWPNQDPLGQRLQFGMGPDGKSPFGERTVVGVVGDIKVRGLERSSEPQLYLSYQQVSDGSLIWYTPKDLVLKSSSDPQALVPALRRIVANADPEQPLSDVRTLSDIVAADTAPRSVQAVSSRAQEIGVRMALGAQARDILMLVLRQGLALAVAGVALGVALAYVVGRGLEALLAGISPRDATAFLAAGSVSLLMVVLGSLLPALRALRVDPLTAIRTE